MLAASPGMNGGNNIGGRRWARGLLALGLTAWLVSSAPVRAEPPTPRHPTHRLTAVAGVFGELGPRKGSYSVGLAYRYTYGEDAEQPLYDNLYVEGALEIYPNPFIPTGRVELTWQPLQIFSLTVAYTTYYYADWSNSLGHGLSLPSQDAPYDGATLARREGEQERQLVQRAEIAPTFQIKIGPVLFYNELELGIWYVEGPKGFWYEPLYDGLVRRGGADLVVMNRTAMVVETWKGPGDATFLLGVVHQVVHGVGADTLRDRLGLVALATPWDRLGPIDRPTLALQPGITLAHESRELEFFLEAVLFLYFDAWEG